ncbi:MAG: hypothetical protein PVJ57_04415 [Phycisphaerae bacterium]|jgi:hypothetical protein
MDESRPPAPRLPAAEGLFETLISAGLLLYMGFYVGLEGCSDSAFYNGSVAAFTYGAQGVGIGLLIVAGLLWARLPVALLLDMIVGVVAAAGCLVIGAIWLLFNDMTGVLLVLFGAWNSVAARNAWQHWRLFGKLSSAANPPPFDE